VEVYQGERGVFCFLEEGKGGEWNVRRRLVLMCRKVLFMERCVQIRAWKEVVCSKYLKWSSWKYFHDKISRFLF
jgi:hypothetical protein